MDLQGFTMLGIAMHPQKTKKDQDRQ